MNEQTVSAIIASAVDTFTKAGCPLDGDQHAVLAGILSFHIIAAHPPDNEATAALMGDLVFKMDGFDDCIIGSVERKGFPDIIGYDARKVVQKLMDRDGMTEDEAVEFYEFNMLGAWVGDTTPCFIDTEVSFETVSQQA